MSEIKNNIEPDDVYWTMDWENTSSHNDHPKTELMFEKPMAIAHLLMNEVLFVNSHYYEKDWPEDAKNKPVFLYYAMMFSHGDVLMLKQFFTQKFKIYMIIF
jgi:hypothetical protein